MIGMKDVSVLESHEPLVDICVHRHLLKTEWWIQLGTGPAFICFTVDHLFFRVLGYGVSVRHNHRPTFSERFGFKQVLRVGGFVFEVLKPMVVSRWN